MKIPQISKKKGGFTLIELMVVIAILAALASIGYGPILDHMNDGDRQKASSNLKSLHTTLLAFKNDQGAYPCDSTAENITEKLGDSYFGELTGETSNPYFRQLIAVQPDLGEKPFFAKISCAGKIIMDEGKGVYNGKALEKGENAFAYVMQPTEEGKKPISKTNAPLAMTSVYPQAKSAPYAGDDIKFDMASFRGHVFVLFGDGSVRDIKGLEPDEMDDDKGTLKEDIFPEGKRGSTASRYTILAPEL